MHKKFFLLLFFCFSQSALGQNITVKGIVMSKTNDERLPGASILIKGTTKGITSDINGAFKINAPLNSVLLIKYVGYIGQEILVKDSSNILVKLKEDAANLNEVIVVGYGIQKKSDITGSLGSVNMSQISQLPVATTDQVLQGQLAGVAVTNNESSPGSSPSIRIRGSTSISGGGDPLVIVNGLRGVNLSSIHPNDIASIEVLKDASATAIYGSQGANGVILITTKTSKTSKPQLAYQGYVSFQQVRKKLDLLTPYEYAKVLNRYRMATDKAPVYSFSELEAFKNGGGTDWQNQIFRLGISHNHHLTLSGGDESFKYYISGDYMGTPQGVVQNTSLNRYRVMPYFSAKIGNNFLISLNLLVSHTDQNYTQQYSRDSEGSPIYSAQVFAPTRPVYNPDGTYSQPGDNIGPNTEYNPLALAVEPIRNLTSTQWIVNPTFEYEFFKGLKLISSVSYNSNTSENGTYYNEKITNRGSNARTAGITNQASSVFQNTNTISYSVDIADIHHLEATGVYELLINSYHSVYTGGSNFPTNDLGYHALQLAGRLSTPFSETRNNNLSSFMGRINYNFNDRLLLTLTGRVDGASVFAENNKYAFFPSAAISWNLINESFIKDLDFFDNLKLRFSYGLVGNAAIQPYQSLAQFSNMFFSYNGTDIISSVGFSTRKDNPNLKWESTTQLNAGIDVSILEGRITLAFDYYRKRTTDLLFERQLLHSSGFSTQLVNAGEIQNNGVEIQLDVVPIRSESFKWKSNLNFTHNENLVVSLDEGRKELLLGEAGLPGFNRSVYLEVGKPLGIIKGYEYAGVWKTEEEEASKYGALPGYSKYVDQNRDGKIDDKDIVSISNAQPLFTFGWTNTFTYQNFELSILINGSVGNQLYNIARSLQETGGGGTSTNLLKAWTPDNNNTDVPALNESGSLTNSSRWTEDASYIRLKNITLSYTHSSDFLKETLFISSIRFYVSVSNLLTFTRYSGFDPEANNSVYLSSYTSGTTDALRGIDLASYPSQRSYTLGVNITF